MEAGRELDALVAEKVMGLTIAHDMTVGDLYRYHPDGDRLLLRRVPNYSTDIADAWQVVERMSELGWVYRSRNGDTPEWYVQFYDGENSADADADTAPLAICLAALESVPAA